MQHRVAVLQEALPYIKQFYGSTIVIKYGGAAMTSPELKASFARDVALLKLVGMNPIVVHGGGSDISRYSDRLGLDVRFVDGLRVTDAQTMELAKMVLVGKVNKEIVGQLTLAGVASVGLAGDDGGLIRAEKVDDGSADLGHVGRVTAIDPKVLDRLGDEFVPVVASVGVGSGGESYNINADTVAAALGKAVHAERVIFLTDVEGLLADVEVPSSLISRTDLATIEKMLEQGASSGMIPKLQAVRDLLRGGVPAAYIIDGRMPHSVLIELLTEAGVGTMITR
ncbi:MAG: acetylglutamate kinase [Thermoleophilia bacterium]|nr:acetylglutamate kinase [Thermoleophilia bacterium]